MHKHFLLQEIIGYYSLLLLDIESYLTWTEIVKGKFGMRICKAMEAYRDVKKSFNQRDGLKDIDRNIPSFTNI